MVEMSGGTRLMQKMREIASNSSSATELKVGFLEGATYPDGESVASVAAENEFGVPSRGQPPRPFFRRMIAAKSGGWGEAISRLLVLHDYDATRALELTGDGIKGQLQQSIATLTDPPLAQSTIARKGHSKPLIDTGHMLNSVDYEVT